MRPVLAPALVVTALLAAGYAYLHLAWGPNHVRRVTGFTDQPRLACLHCHFVSLDQAAWSKPRPRHPAPADLVVAPDGRKLYVALPDVGEVAEADVVSRQVIRRVQVPGAPTGLALDPAGDRLYVACREADRLAVLDTKAFQEVATIRVGFAPVAVAYCATQPAPRLVVANSGSDNISILTVEPLHEVARQQAGREPFAVTASNDGTLAFIANRLAVTERQVSIPASELTVLDVARSRVVARHRLDSAHLSEGVTAVPQRPWTLTPLVKVRNLVPITQVANGWVMSSGLALAGPRGPVVQLPLDEAHDYFADPSGIVADPAGRRAYVASGGSDVVSVIDLDRLVRWLEAADDRTKTEAIEDLSLSAEYVIRRLPTARNPRHLALSPDGRLLFVAEKLNDSILVVDTAELEPLGRIVLGNGGLHDPIRRGERVFTDAAHTFQRQFSCRSCHPDGHVDGLSYDFDGDGIGDNFLDNRTLLGIDGTAPFKWNGKNPTLEIQCGPRFARVLMRTDPIPPDALKDLTTFIKSQPPGRTPYHKQPGDPLTAAEERGRQIFFAERTPAGIPIPVERRCHTCHPPPFYTIRLPTAVGSKGPRDSTDHFDTPQLLGIAATAPYLHDGRARTLEELWTTYQTNDLHGVSSYMTKQQLNDLVEFLKTL